MKTEAECQAWADELTRVTNAVERGIIAYFRNRLPRPLAQQLVLSYVVIQADFRVLRDMTDFDTAWAIYAPQHYRLKTAIEKLMDYEAWLKHTHELWMEAWECAYDSAMCELIKDFA